MKMLPTKKKIVFISRQSNKMSLDFRLIIEKLFLEDPSIKTICLCKSFNMSPKGILGYGFHIFLQMYHLATSEVCVLDSYCIPVSILKHKKNLIIIQMWHAIGSMKKFGHAIINKKEGRDEKIAHALNMHKNYDFVFTSSNRYTKNLSEGFNCPPECIIPMTLPRVDLLFDENFLNQTEEKIYLAYPELEKRKTILYCPTFREEDCERKLNEAALDLINSINLDKYNLIIKFHPLTNIELKSSDSVIIDQQFTTFEMLSISDIVISDYSCIIYEAGILKKPIYFYAFDKEDYIKNRGFAIDYENELPGKISADPKDLIDSLESEYDYKKLDIFINRYVTEVEGCTQKIVDFITGFIDGGRK